MRPTNRFNPLEWRPADYLLETFPRLLRQVPAPPRTASSGRRVVCGGIGTEVGMNPFA
jgi:hypothetical protein